MLGICNKYRTKIMFLFSFIWKKTVFSLNQQKYSIHIILYFLIIDLYKAFLNVPKCNAVLPFLENITMQYFVR